MRVTFPIFGNSYLAAKALFDGMKVDYVLPPLNNKDALEIGIMYSPDEICLPFKLMMGNYIQSIKNGADTVIIAGSCGPCRFGEYCELQMRILKKLGYDINFIVIDNPKSLGKKEILNRIARISNAGRASNMEKVNSARMSYEVLKYIETIQKKAMWLSGYEKEKGQCRTLLNSCKKECMNTHDPHDMLNVLHSYYRKISNVKIDKSKNPIKIQIIGEIYTIIEPFANLCIEEKLMDMEVSVERKITPLWWVNDTALKAVKLNSLGIKMASRKYMPYYVGGYAKESIGEAVISARRGMDGIIQIFPVGCMPEIVTKSVLPTISRDFHIPMLTLIVDEMTGEAGYETRLEAFIDLIERRKMHVLYGS